MKKLIFRFKDQLFLICLSSSLVFIWFYKGLIFAGGEEGIPFYNLNNAFYLFAYSWRDFSGGIPMSTDLARIPFFWILKLLSNYSIPSYFLQAATFLTLIIVGVVSVYYLLKITLGNRLKSGSLLEQRLYSKVSLIGAIFYLLNPYSMVQVWGRGLYNQFFPFALLPLFLVLFIQGVKKKRFIYGLLAVISSLLLSVSFGQPSYVISIWLTIFIYIVFEVFKTKDFAQRKFIILYSLTVFTSWILVHSWWIWPLFKTINETVDKLGDLQSNIGSLKGISKDSPIWVIMTLTHKFLFAGAYGNIYSGLPFKLISLLVPISFFVSLPLFKRFSYFKFYLCLFLVSIFIVSGTNFPFGWLFLWFFKNISIFQVFRNPYEKMGIVLMLACIPFISIGLVKTSILIHKFYKKISAKVFLLILMFLMCGIYVWPMWTGQFAGGVVMSPWASVPVDYKLANDWIKSQDTNSRIIQFPLNPGDGVFYTWQNAYRGIEPSEFIFDNSSIGRNVAINKVYYNVLLERFGVLQKNAFGPDPDISSSEFRSENLYQELNKLDVRYIVLHNDINEKLSGLQNSKEVSQYLSKQKNIQKVNTFGLLDIYEVKVRDGVDRIYSPNVKTNYQKVNPTFYRFNVENSTSKAQLNFLETYSPNWELFIDGKEIETHSIVFSYANSWTINRTGTYSGYIKYKTQDYVTEGGKISIVTLIVLIIMIVVLVLKKRIKKEQW
ncbi:MAG TPA: hypothetical protein VFI61_01465 [Patescibacteria group bacterium]|nr:hypothetical protein [Patescibacteria group bacterium]